MPKDIVPPAPEDVARLLAKAESDDPELLTFLALDAETGARRAELGSLRLSDFGDDEVKIARALVIGPATPENERKYAGHYWPSAYSRGKTRTALIEKPRPKTRGSVRTIALSPATMALVDAQRARLARIAFEGGTSYPADAFLFPSEPDGLRPLRPDTWTDRFVELRDELGLKTVRLHDLRHFVATSLIAAGVDIGTVAGRLGHGGGGKTTLAIYSHFMKKPDRTASDVMAAILKGAAEPDKNEAEVIPLRAVAGGRRASKGRAADVQAKAQTRGRRPGKGA